MGQEACHPANAIGRVRERKWSAQLSAVARGRGDGAPFREAQSRREFRVPVRRIERRENGGNCKIAAEDTGGEEVSHQLLIPTLCVGTRNQITPNPVSA